MHYIPSPATYKQALAGRIRTLREHVEPSLGVDGPLEAFPPKSKHCNKYSGLRNPVYSAFTSVAMMVIVRANLRSFLIERGAGVEKIPSFVDYMENTNHSYEIP